MWTNHSRRNAGSGLKWDGGHTSRMEVVTTDTVPGETVAESLGVVRGNTVRARNVGRDITQSIRNITGGELKAYS